LVFGCIEEYMLDSTSALKIKSRPVRSECAKEDAS
jgi:hypothetical protein